MIGEKKKGELLCFYCCRKLNDGTPHGAQTKDHLYPRSFLRDNQIKHECYDIGNVVACCRKCNRDKADNLPSLSDICKFHHLSGHYPFFLFLDERFQKSLTEARSFR